MFLQILLLLISLFCFYHLYWKRRNLPPGPIPLPFLGNTVEISKNQPGYELYKKWSKEYGPVYTFWLGETPLVAVTDMDLIVEHFVKDGDSFAGRQQLPSILLHVRGGYNGILFTEGDLWRDQRRFALTVFRNLGLGKNIMQERVFVELSSLIEQIQNDLKAGRDEINIIPYIDVAVGSLINGLLFGYRFEGKNLHEYFELKEKLKKFVAATGNPWIFAIQKNFFYTKYLPFFCDKFNEMQHAANVLLEFYQKQLDEHQRMANHDSEPTNYVEAFLKEKAEKEEENGNAGDFTWV